ncbi:Uncharacterized protein TCM_011108 [Theobroma cacao]|uniref:Uncharacterized protein n=1 Tax=Theobroma cacao TaxID=3641 RepID=A0A061EFZ0_THECC|nr:Uncharacterized protein TCM_011108 [Theobroma cacao]
MTTTISRRFMLDGTLNSFLFISAKLPGVKRNCLCQQKLIRANFLANLYHNEGDTRKSLQTSIHGSQWQAMGSLESRLAIISSCSSKTSQLSQLKETLGVQVIVCLFKCRTRYVVSQLVGISSWSSRIRVESLNAEGVVGCLVANLVHKLCWAAAGGCKGWGEDVTREKHKMKSDNFFWIKFAARKILRNI